MRKIKLQIESLAVESFHTTRTEPDPGTVAGHEFTIGCQTGPCLESGNDTCARSCPFTCPHTCSPSDEPTCPGEDSCGGGFCTDPPMDSRDLGYSCAEGLC